MNVDKNYYDELKEFIEDNKDTKFISVDSNGVFDNATYEKQLDVMDKIKDNNDIINNAVGIFANKKRFPDYSEGIKGMENGNSQKYLLNMLLKYGNHVSREFIRKLYSPEERVELYSNDRMTYDGVYLRFKNRVDIDDLIELMNENGTHDYATTKIDIFRLLPCVKKSENLNADKVFKVFIKCNYSSFYPIQFIHQLNDKIDADKLAFKFIEYATKNDFGLVLDSNFLKDISGVISDDTKKYFIENLNAIIGQASGNASSKSTLSNGLLLTKDDIKNIRDNSGVTNIPTILNDYIAELYLTDDNYKINSDILTQVIHPVSKEFEKQVIERATYTNYRYLRHTDDEIKKIAINTNVSVLRFFNEISEKMADYAVSKSAESILYIDNPTLDQVYESVVRTNAYMKCIPSELLIEERTQRKILMRNINYICCFDDLDNGLVNDLIVKFPYLVTELIHFTDYISKDTISSVKKDVFTKFY